MAEARKRRAGGTRTGGIGAKVTILIPDRRWTRIVPDARAVCRIAAKAALAMPSRLACALPAKGVEVSILLTDDPALQELNARFRGLDKPTDVLSFPTLEPDALLPEGNFSLGDLAVAFETSEADARAQDKALGDHLSHLVIHGMLHLLGHDHIDPAEAEIMEQAERDALAALGIADPYAGMEAA